MSTVSLQARVSLFFQEEQSGFSQQATIFSQAVSGLPIGNSLSSVNKEQSLVFQLATVSLLSRRNRLWSPDRQESLRRQRGVVSGRSTGNRVCSVNT